MQTNTPPLWQDAFPVPDAQSHKYTRGHALVNGGPLASTGAARLAAVAALRAGAGLVSVVCDREALPVYAATLLSVMTKPAEKESDYAALLEDARVTALLLGPGNGVTSRMQNYTRLALESHKPAVLDADSLSAIAAARAALFPLLHGACVLTPHEGEFARLFPALQGTREMRAQKAAEESGAVVVLKGSATLIASPDGRLAVNQNAPPWLATAGSGDVLAGIITGLLAQGMPRFEAACAASWLHGEAANRLGPGLIAEDLPIAIPKAIATLINNSNIN